MFLAVRMFSIRRILERLLVLVKSSHFRCFLLLRHFVLKFLSPKYNGIFIVTLKCIAKARMFFVILSTYACVRVVCERVCVRVSNGE